jgi:hypothetical protein
MRRTSSAPVRWLAVALVPLLALAVYGSAAAAPPAQAPVCRWTKLTNGESRSELSLVGLPGTGVLAFGGADMRPGNSSVKDDLHLLDLSASASGTWKELTPSGSGPGDRAEHTAVFRSEVGGNLQMVTYGGIDTVPAGGGTLTWQSPLTAGGPTLDSRLGAFAPLTVERDAFRLDIDKAGTAAWIKVGAQGQARADHSAVYDPVDDAMLVFGGRRSDEATSAENSTWRLTLGATAAWEPLSGGGTPPSKRFAHTAVYDSVGKRMVVYGGTSDWKTALGDVFALNLAGGWDAATWTKLTPGGTPPATRYNHGAVYLPEMQWMVVYGGTKNGQGQYPDTYALDLSVTPPKWIEINAIGTRPGDMQSMGAARGLAGAAVFYGGQTGTASQPTSQKVAWSLSCEGATPPTMTPTATETAPTPTASASATTGPSDVTVTGLVYNAAGGPSAPIVGAIVAVGLSVPHQPFTAVTGSDGRYSLLVPADYIGQVNQISVTAEGYATLSQAVTGAELAANSQRDFALNVPTAVPTTPVTPDVPTATATSTTPDKFRVFAPIILKAHSFGGR